jgi:hypothetical protein
MGKPDDCAGLPILHFRGLDGGARRSLPSRAVLARGSYRSKAEDGLLKVLRHRVEQTAFVRKTEITCLHSSLNFREVTLTLPASPRTLWNKYPTAPATFLIQIRSSSRVSRSGIFFKSLEAVVTRDSDGTSMTNIVMQNVAQGPESVGS